MIVEKLKERLAQISDLENAAAVLSWDQQTSMPPGGAGARADQLATLARLSHELFTAAETGELLEQAEREVGGESDSDAAALVRVTRRDFDRAVKIPAALVAEMRHTSALAQEAWAQARPANDYAAFAPWLEKNLDLARRAAECLGYADRLYDALLDIYEPGTTTAQVETMFGELKPALVSLVRAIGERGTPIDDAVLHREFDEARQR